MKTKTFICILAILMLSSCAGKIDKAAIAKEYHDYDNMLKQSDKDLAIMKVQYENADKEYNNYAQHMKKVKEDYIKYCK